jgi:IclR family mhp operon transcriptional activator
LAYSGADAQLSLEKARKPSYLPVQSVRRAFEILRVLNYKHIASIRELHDATGLPKPTIVRMLDTLIADGFVARDSMCRGYHVTHKVRELYSGYEGIAELIEVARPFAIDLTTRIKWPLAIGTFDGDAFAVRFWTGSISPVVHTNRLVGNRPNLITSAMGRAYLAFCPDPQREKILAQLRNQPGFDAAQEEHHLALLARVRASGFATRAPNTEPIRHTTVAIPIRQEDGPPLACITVSFFKSAIPPELVPERIINPLREVVSKIEDVMAFLRKERAGSMDALSSDGSKADHFFESGEIDMGY